MFWRKESTGHFFREETLRRKRILDKKKSERDNLQSDWKFCLRWTPFKKKSGIMGVIYAQVHHDCRLHQHQHHQHDQHQPQHDGPDQNDDWCSSWWRPRETVWWASTEDWTLIERTMPRKNTGWSIFSPDFPAVSFIFVTSIFVLKYNWKTDKYVQISKDRNQLSWAIYLSILDAKASPAPALHLESFQKMNGRCGGKKHDLSRQYSLFMNVN